MSNFGLSEFGAASFGGDPATALILEVDAEVTSRARRLIARGRTDGTGFKVIEFSVGQGGLDLFDYKVATPVNPDAVQLELPINIAGNPTKAIAQYEHPNLNSGCVYCLLDNSEVNERLSEVGIWAEIKCSPSLSEVGATFLAAIAHFPLLCKNSSMKYAFRVNVQF
jgi:hypothetical protein